MKKNILYVAFFLGLPLVASAEPFDGIQGLLGGVKAIINLLIPILVGLALIAFFWGLAKFIYNAASDTKREEGKQVMIWGIIALFVIVSIWGIIGFIQGELGIFPGEPQLEDSVLDGSTDFDPNGLLQGGASV